MSTVAQPFHFSRKSWVVVSALCLLVLFAIASPDLHRARLNPPETQRLLVTTSLIDTSSSGMHGKEVSDVETTGGRGAIRDSTRKVRRDTSIDLLVKSPTDAAEKIRQLAENMGGFLVNSQSGGPDAVTASLTIRVPAARFEEARAQIKKLATHVELEAVQANDVTREYVDMDARLRNLRAQETQYLEIMKRATTVDETLKVSDKLADVRGQIEQQQAEFNALSKQVETVLMTVSLRSEVEAQVFGLNWRPLYRLKVAARDALDALGNYASFMTSVVLFLPVALLWTATLVVAALITWRLLRWAARFFIPAKVPATQG
jgi:hypothetical protein